MELNVKISNVPVVLEVKSVGPASIEDIDSFKEKIRSGDLVLVDQSTQMIPTVNPYFKADEEIVDIESTLEPEVEVEPPVAPIEEPESLLEGIVNHVPEIIDEFKEIFGKESFGKEESKDGKKPWWKSKTILSNIVAAGGCMLGTLVSDNPETSAYLPASILAIINLGLRSISTGGVTLPMEDKINKFIKK